MTPGKRLGGTASWGPLRGSCVSLGGRSHSPLVYLGGNGLLIYVICAASRLGCGGMIDPPFTKRRQTDRRSACIFSCGFDCHPFDLGACFTLREGRCARSFGTARPRAGPKLACGNVQRRMSGRPTRRRKCSGKVAALRARPALIPAADRSLPR